MSLRYCIPGGPLFPYGIAYQEAPCVPMVLHTVGSMDYSLAGYSRNRVVVHCVVSASGAKAKNFKGFEDIHLNAKASI